MSARTLRRTFASPFIVTVAACTMQSGPPPQGPGPGPGTAQHPGHGDPDSGRFQNQNGAPRPGDSAQTTGPTQSADTSERHWTIQKQGGKCLAFSKVSCPPNVSCNPPRPSDYACTPDVAEGGSLAVVRWQGSTTCMVEQPPMNCPAGMSCNPPPPRQVSCPQ